MNFKKMDQLSEFHLHRAKNPMKELAVMMNRLDRITGTFSHKSHARYQHVHYQKPQQTLFAELARPVLKSSLSSVFNSVNGRSDFRASQGQLMALLASSISRAMKRNL